jgi:hypothetical protein
MVGGVVEAWVVPSADGNDVVNHRADGDVAAGLALAVCCLGCAWETGATEARTGHAFEDEGVSELLGVLAPMAVVTAARGAAPAVIVGEGFGLLAVVRTGC